MATVKIDRGTVFRIIENYGFVATEEVKNRNGETIKLYYTVWTNEKVKLGDEVEISGQLGVKLEEYTGADNIPKTKAATHINHAFVGFHESDAPF